MSEEAEDTERVRELLAQVDWMAARIDDQKAEINRAKSRETLLTRDLSVWEERFFRLFDEYMNRI